MLLFLVVAIRECFLGSQFLLAVTRHSRERKARKDTTGGRQNAERSALVSRTRSEDQAIDMWFKHHLPMNHHSRAASSSMMAAWIFLVAH
jgi:hypothetical protein